MSSGGGKLGGQGCSCFLTIIGTLAMKVFGGIGFEKNYVFLDTSSVLKFQTSLLFFFLDKANMRYLFKTKCKRHMK